MQHTTSRILSLLLALVMVLSMIPTVFAAEDSASVAYAAENTTTGAQYESINDAIAAAQAGQIVKALADAEDVIYNTEGVILDLNGHDLSVTAAEGVTLSAIDSATDDYEGDYGSLTTDGTVAATVKTTGEVKSYVTIAENGSYTFHRYYAAIAAISLKPTQVALGYRAEFRGDEAVKNAVTGYGYEMWLNGGAHKTYSRTDALEKSSLTLRLKNILAEGNDVLNAIGSTATIGGNAFITLNLNGEEVKLYGTEQETTLRQVVESVNANVSSYGEVQLESVRTMITTYASWMEGWATDAIFGNGESEGDGTGLKVEITVDVTAENGVLTQDATLSNEDITVTVPQGTTLEDGTTQLTLTITEKASSDSGVTAEEDETLLPLDVHIEGISADNTTPILVCLGEVLPKGLNIGNYQLYHVENGQTVEMTHVLTLAELDTHNEFHYDPATGAVTVAMASFSEITLRSVATGTWEGGVDHTWYTANPNADQNSYCIYNADQLWSFSQIVGGMTQDADGNAITDAEGNVIQDSFAGKTVILHADIDLDDLDSENGRVFYPIGYYSNDGKYEKTGEAISSWVKSFEGTFDGNGHTIANFYQNTWEMKGDHNWYAAEEQRYRDGMGLFGRVYGGTVKNLTVKDFSSDGEICTTGTIAAYAECGAIFENISIFNCNPRVYNIGNGGIVGCVGWYAVDVVDTPVTFKNITVDNTNKISALWGSWDVACGGLVGQYYPTSGQTSATENAGIYMENCHVAAQIDVNNDVCANYQYYAYRYAGMLIGSVRENVNGTDGRVYPKMDGITAKDCTVHYGTWNDYYYCELVANTLASYTHDHQMSRLTQVADVDLENMKYLPLGATEYVDISADSSYNFVVVDGEHATENAKCFHILKNHEVWNHTAGGYEETDIDGDGEIDSDVLKEDKQHLYLEFYDQLVTGYGWGVTSKGIADVPGVTVLDKLDGGSDQKFVSNVKDGAVYTSGSTVSVGSLFALNSEAVVPLYEDNIQVFVSPVADEDGKVTSTASGIYTPDSDNWENGYLTFTGTGKAQIIITDYFYCTPTVIEIEIGSIYGYRVTDIKEITDGGMFVVVAEYKNTLYAVDATPKREKLNGVEVTTVTQTVDGVETEFVVVGSAVVWYANKTSTNQITLQSGGQYITGGTRNLSTSSTPVYWNVSEYSGLYSNDYEFLLQYSENSTRYLAYHGVNPDVEDGEYYWFGTFAGSNMSDPEEFTFGLRFYKIAEACEHNEDYWTTVVTSAATCTTAGTQTTICSICSTPMTDSVTIPATGHTEVIDEAVAATCTTDGLTEGSHCSVCDEVIVAQEVIPGGHTYDADGICTVCGEETPVYNITFIENKVESPETVVQGESITLPTVEAPEGYTFVGWTTGTVNDTTEKPETIYAAEADYTPTANTTLYAVYSYSKGGTGSAGYEEKALADIKSDDEVIITMTKGSTIYALFSGNGTSSAPTAVTVTFSNGNLAITTADVTEDEILWNIGGSADAYIFYPNGTTTTWLYCTNNNNGLRVGTSTDNTFKISSNYLYNNGQSRYIGVYETNPDWRSYTSINTNITGQTLGFYVLTTGDTTYYTTVICDHSNTTTETIDATCTEAGSVTVTCDDCGTVISTETIEATGHINTTIATVQPSCTEAGSTTETCNDCGKTVSTEEIAALGHNYVDGTCTSCGAEESTSTEPTLVLEITVADFNSTSYAANNNTKTENGYSYTSYQVMNQSSAMQWQKSKGYITITSNVFTKLELKVTAGTFTVTVGGTTVTGTTSNGVTTYDLTGLTGEIKISVGSSTGKVDYLKFYA